MATTKVVKSAFDIAEETTHAQTVMQSAPVFFVQMGWDKLVLDTPAIPNYTLRRAEVTPCLNYLRWDRIVNIPLGMRVAGTERITSMGAIEPDNAAYICYASAEARRLEEWERHQLKMGLVRLTSLDGLRLNDVKQINFNKILFDNMIEQVSEKWPSNSELRGHIETVLEMVRQKKYREAYPEVFEPAVIGTLNEMLQGIDYVDRLQRERLDYTHACFKVPPGDPKFKASYDQLDEEMLVRTGKARFDHAQDATVQLLETLTQQSIDKDSGEKSEQIILKLYEQNQQLIEQIKQQSEAMSVFIQLLANKDKAERTVERPFSANFTFGVGDTGEGEKG